MRFFKEFYYHGRFEKSLDAKYFVLISNKEGVEDLKDLRPISLVGGLLMILAKVLAKRLKKVLGKLVPKH